MNREPTATPRTMHIAAGVALALILVAAGAVTLLGLPQIGSAGGGLGVGGAAAQEINPPESPGITVIGDGVVKAQPNTTTIRLGVEVTAETPAAALSRTRDATERVLQRMRERGVPEADLQTSGLNVYPIRGSGRDGPPDLQPITGYRGNASLTVQTPDVTQVGALLDAATQAGATSVQGLSFGLRDETAARQQALVAAVNDARPRAEAAATAAGLRVTGVRAVVEIPYGPPKGAAGFGGGGEGIAPGELSVIARVQVTYDVARA